MSWRTNSAVLALRDFGRILGLNRLVAGLGKHGYEEDYDAQLSSCVRPGDTVWDIGANIGYYTTQFSDQVGPNGKVIAFEPSATNFVRLRESCKELRNVSLQACGLGDVSGQLRFKQGEDPLGATSQFVDDDSGDGVVDVWVGDELIAQKAIQSPNIIKMDVEGFEGEVVSGLSACLASPQLRAVGIEIHFGVLRQRDRGHVPREIESALRKANFNVSWPDLSHVLATR